MAEQGGNLELIAETPDEAAGDSDGYDTQPSSSTEHTLASPEVVEEITQWWKRKYTGNKVLPLTGVQVQLIPKQPDLGEAGAVDLTVSQGGLPTTEFV